MAKTKVVIKQNCPLGLVRRVCDLIKKLPTPPYHFNKTSVLGFPFEFFRMCESGVDPTNNPLVHPQPLCFLCLPVICLSSPTLSVKLTLLFSSLPLSLSLSALTLCLSPALSLCLDGSSGFICSTERYIYRLNFISGMQ